MAREHQRDRGRPAAGDGVVVRAESGSQVGQQVGVSYGTVQQTVSHAAPGPAGEVGEPAELWALLVELRVTLEQARAARQIDARTFRDATEELTRATEAAAEIAEATGTTEDAEDAEGPEDAGSPDPERRGRLLRSLEKLRTVVQDVSGIAVAVSGIIGAAGGRP
jgi:hypothetical protein